MRFRNRSGELFFLLLACLAQVVTVLACTLWREVVFVPERWKGPPLTQEYLVWYLDEYVPPIDYEGQLFSLYFPFAPLLGLLLVVGLVWLFFRFYRKGPGQKKVFFPLVAAGFLGIWDSPSGCGSTASPTTSGWTWFPCASCPGRSSSFGGSPGSAPGAGSGPCLRCRPKIFAQTVPSSGQNTPLPTAQVPLRMGRGVCLAWG